MNPSLFILTKVFLFFTQVSDDWDLPTRVRLNISAAAPVIIIPVSSQHKDVLVMDLGNLSVTNSFKWSDSNDQNSDETQSEQSSSPYLDALCSRSVFTLMQN